MTSSKGSAIIVAMGTLSAERRIADVGVYIIRFNNNITFYEGFRELKCGYFRRPAIPHIFLSCVCCIYLSRFTHTFHGVHCMIADMHSCPVTPRVCLMLKHTNLRQSDSWCRKEWSVRTLNTFRHYGSTLCDYMCETRCGMRIGNTIHWSYA